MALVRYTASADTTITNAFQPNLRTRGTGANMGMADVLEVYSIYGRQTTSSAELSRVLIQFPTTGIAADRTAEKIPASGSVNFYLRMFNAPHSKTVPRDYKLFVAAISQSWEEGVGLDLEGYSDLTKGNTGANWMSASSTTKWAQPGGKYILTPSTTYVEKGFTTGLEDLEVDITPIVERWIAGTQANYGVEILLSSSYEAYFSASAGVDSGSIIHNTLGATKSYYTKRFFARGSQYFFKRPLIEARWDDVKRDDRGDFHLSSSRASGEDNLNLLYFYNVIRGKLANLPSVGTGSIIVSLYSGSADNTKPSGSKLTLYGGATGLTGGWVSTGVYTCSVAITGATTAAKRVSPMYDVWYSGTTQYFTGSISPSKLASSEINPTYQYVTKITNLKSAYGRSEEPRLRVYTREKNRTPTVYTVANADAQTTAVEDAYYKVLRLYDMEDVVSYGTGSSVLDYTRLSYDVSGSYFDLDMTLLEADYAYGIRFAYYLNGAYKEQKELFKFRVEE